MLQLENSLKRQGFNLIIGVDEAGRGPLAGPVVASAITLKQRRFTSTIADSKKLSAQKRESAFYEIYEKAYVGIGIISEAVIDQVNILEATYLAMNNAIVHLLAQLKHPKVSLHKKNQKVCLLIDGNRFKSDLPYACRNVIHGDERVFSIACASIVAKVTRDRILRAYDQIFPEYGFKSHKGYLTPRHRKALVQFGPSEIHRLSFKY